MSPERKEGKGLRNSMPSTSTTASVADPSASIHLPQLPEEIILSILKLLPVKSILRFKCVSKEWLSLLSTPKFISIHRQLTSNNPLNHSLIIHSFDECKVSLLNVYSAETDPIPLVIPSPALSEETMLVGSINGLVCLSCPPDGRTIILWNPAMNLYKVIRPAPVDTLFSFLGFGYDYVDDDYKIIGIDHEKESSNPESLLRVGAQVYSSNLDCWKRVEIDFPFFPIGGSHVIAKGIPYWNGLLFEGSNQDKYTNVLVYYDMQNVSFKHIPAAKLAGDLGKRYVEWKGNLGIMAVSSPSVEKNDFIDILVYDEIGWCWNKISSHGPIGFKIERTPQCSKDGVIFAVSLEGKLILYDPVTNGIKEFYIPGSLEDFLEAVPYTESLVTIKGMEKVKEEDKDKYT